MSDFADAQCRARRFPPTLTPRPKERTSSTTGRLMMRRSLTADQILVVIPTLNEAHSIGPTIERLRRQGCVDVRVIDNGSTDGSASAARSADAEVIAEPVKGYGMACWRGLQDLPAAHRMDPILRR